MVAELVSTLHLNVLANLMLKVEGSNLDASILFLSKIVCKMECSNKDDSTRSELQTSIFGTFEVDILGGFACAYLYPYVRVRICMCWPS